MKKKLLLFIIRLIRLFKAEDTFMPNLRAVPEGSVKTGRLYRYYGRILVSRPYEGAAVTYFERSDTGEWVQCSLLRYQEAFRLRGPEKVSISTENMPCRRCACQNLGLPCRCDFTGGSYTGYYELVHQDTQYSDNITV